MFISLYRTHRLKTGIAAEMLWVRLRPIPAELLPLVESKTSGFREVGVENATPTGTRQQVKESLGAMKAYLVDAAAIPGSNFRSISGLIRGPAVYRRAIPLTSANSFCDQAR